jgi:hypothetical protein
MSNYNRKISVEYSALVIYDAVNRCLNANSKYEMINQNELTCSYTIKLADPLVLFNIDIINSESENGSLLLTIIESKNETSVDNTVINEFLNSISKYFEIADKEQFDHIINKKDDLIVDVSKHIVKFQICNESEIQKKFRLGYNRTGRIIDELETIGIVGMSRGSKNRLVICNDFFKLNNILIEHELIKKTELIIDVVEEKKKFDFFSFLKK